MRAVGVVAGDPCARYDASSRVSCGRRTRDRKATAERHDKGSLLGDMLSEIIDFLGSLLVTFADEPPECLWGFEEGCCWQGRVIQPDPSCIMYNPTLGLLATLAFTASHSVLPRTGLPPRAAHQPECGDTLSHTSPAQHPPLPQLARGEDIGGGLARLRARVALGKGRQQLMRRGRPM